MPDFNSDAFLHPGCISALIDHLERYPKVGLVGPRLENGDGSLQSVVVKSVTTGAERVIPCVAMFVFIGVKPHTDAFAGVVERDEQGFIITGADLPKEHGRPRGWTLERDPFMFETNIPGVFAAGDVRAGANRRVAAAVGEGSAAIYSVHRYLRTV